MGKKKTLGGENMANVSRRLKQKVWEDFKNGEKNLTILSTRYGYKVTTIGKIIDEMRRQEKVVSQLSDILAPVMEGQKKTEEKAEEPERTVEQKVEAMCEEHEHDVVQELVDEGKLTVPEEMQEPIRQKSLEEMLQEKKDGIKAVMECYEHQIELKKTEIDELEDAIRKLVTLRDAYSAVLKDVKQ